MTDPKKPAPPVHHTPPKAVVHPAKKPVHETERAAKPEPKLAKRTLKHVYGCIKDFPDKRDLLYREIHAHEKPPMLPPRVSLAGAANIATVYDQLQLGSCTANAACSAVDFIRGKFSPSRLHLYFMERVLEGTVDNDAGAQVRDSVKALNKWGVGTENEWPYDIAKFADRPSLAARDEAYRHKISVYSRLITGDDFRTCLAAGFPFIIGFTVYPQMESDYAATTGIVTWPEKGAQPLGGHCVMVIGYDDELNKPGTPLNGKAVYRCRNSWSGSWGEGGNFWIPAAYLEDENLSGDSWTIRL